MEKWSGNLWEKIRNTKQIEPGGKKSSNLKEEKCQVIFQSKMLN